MGSTGKQFADKHMGRRVEAAEAAGFIRGRAAAHICDALNIDQLALYRRARQLAEHKAVRVREQRERDAKNKERRLQMASLTAIKRNAETAIRRIKTAKK